MPLLQPVANSLVLRALFPGFGESQGEAATGEVYKTYKRGPRTPPAVHRNIQFEQIVYEMTNRMQTIFVQTL